MNNSDLIDLLTTCKTICGTEAKFYSRFKKDSVHAVMPSKFAAIDNALDKAIAALSAKEPCCGEYATCARPCTPRGRWLQFQSTAKLPEVEEWIMTERKCVCDLKKVCLTPICTQEFKPCSGDLNWCCNIGKDGIQCAHDKECHQQQETTK